MSRSPLRDPRALIRVASRALPAVAGSSVLLSGFHLERRLVGDDLALRDRWVRRWCSTMIRSLAVRPIVDDESRLKLSAESLSPRLLVANHRSTIDIFVMLSLFDGHMLARGDMARWPLMGRLAKVAHTIFVDRDDPQSGAASVKAMRDRLKAGRTIGVFPEGTTFAGDEVRPFHAGAFLAIARERGDVVPIGIAYARDDIAFGDESMAEHMARVLSMPEIRVSIAIGDAIASKGLGVQPLADRTRAAVQQLVHQARQSL